MKKNKSRGRFWPVGKLAQLLEVSPSSIVASAKICGHVVLPGGVVRLPATKCAQRTEFIAESIRADLADSRQQARLHAD